LRIKKIRSDNGTKFKNSQIEGFLKEEGIKHEFSSPYTPQQNGVVERKNRTLLDMARTMLDEYKTPDRFWAEAINTACYSINRLYLQRILKKTSYELLTNKKPNVSYFRVFGSCNTQLGDIKERNKIVCNAFSFIELLGDMFKINNTPIKYASCWSFVACAYNNNNNTINKKI
jgi:transposase InsO family protein